MTDLVLLAFGVLAAAVGGELFVRGAVGIAAWARVPAAIIGTTIAAFATSSPEMSVAVQSALDGKPEIALGDALGSNVVNIAVVLGIALVVGPLTMAKQEVRREMTVAAMAPVLTIAVLADGTMSRYEAALLLVAFVAWLVFVVREAAQRRTAVGAHFDAPPRAAAVLWTLAGLVCLVIAGRLIVVAAKGIGEALDIDPFVVGATLVAFGTSTPELATTIIARIRGFAEVGVGTVLGSNVFNNLWIVGVAGLLHPIETDPSEVTLAVGACLIALVLLVPRHGDVIGRRRGVALLVVAVAYAAGTVALGTQAGPDAADVFNLAG
jgi:cation:H+ antiporter